VGEDGRGSPVRVDYGRKRPVEVVEGEASADVGIVGDIGLVVIVNEIELAYLGVEDEDGQQEA